MYLSVKKKPGSPERILTALTTLGSGALNGEAFSSLGQTPREPLGQTGRQLDPVSWNRSSEMCVSVLDARQR